MKNITKLNNPLENYDHPTPNYLHIYTKVIKGKNSIGAAATLWQNNIILLNLLKWINLQTATAILVIIQRRIEENSIIYTESNDLIENIKNYYNEK